MTDIKPKSRRVPVEALIFICSFAVLTLGGFAVLLIPAVDKGFTAPFTHSLVIACATVMRIFGGHIQTAGSVLAFADGRGAVMVANGCNAVEVSILFAAAVLAFPAPPVARVIGAVAGVAAIQALNLFRIISLLILARVWQSAFDFFHLYVWDALIMLDGIVLFLAWNHWQSRRWRPTAKAEPAA